MNSADRVFSGIIVPKHYGYDYRFKDNDRSNFIHVFFKDPLWSKLPIDCILVVLCWVKRHNPRRWWLDEMKPFKLASIYSPFLGPVLVPQSPSANPYLLGPNMFQLPEAYMARNQRLDE